MQAVLGFGTRVHWLTNLPVSVVLPLMSGLPLRCHRHFNGLVSRGKLTPENPLCISWGKFRWSFRLFFFFPPIHWSTGKSNIWISHNGVPYWDRNMDPQHLPPICSFLGFHYQDWSSLVFNNQCMVYVCCCLIIQIATFSFGVFADLQKWISQSG